MFSGHLQLSSFTNPVPMNPDTITALLYLLAGTAILNLFRQRRRALSGLRPDDLPELSQNDFTDLVLLLKTAYERMLYLGVLFFPLAFSSLNGSNRTSTLFFLLLIGLLFLSNIGPRHRIMALLERNGLTTAELRNRGIRL